MSGAVRIALRRARRVGCDHVFMGLGLFGLMASCLSAFLSVSFLILPSRASAVMVA